MTPLPPLDGEGGSRSETGGVLRRRWPMAATMMERC
jgi:hypothetical protein